MTDYKYINDFHDINVLYDILLRIVSLETLDVVFSINGFKEDTARDILYCVTGYRYFKQFLAEVEDEDY